MIVRPPQPPFTEAEWDKIRVRILRRAFKLMGAVAVAGLIWSWLNHV